MKTTQAKKMKLKSVILLLELTLALSTTACTKPDEAVLILEREGYTNIQVTDYAFFGCSQDDTFRTKFRATKNEHPVEGVVCSGFFKGSTVRVFN